MRRWAFPTSLGLAALTMAATSCGPAGVETGLKDTAPVPIAAARETPSAPPPRAVVEGETVYRFGMKPQRSSFARSWTIRNDGAGPLIVEPEPPSCSCVAVELPRLSADATDSKLTIAPGGKATITLTWQTRDFDGRFQWPLALVTNDPRQPKLTFTAEGMVRPPVALDPKAGINLADVYDDEGDHHATITAYSPDRADLKLTRITTSRPGLLEVEPKPLSTEECRSMKAASGYRLDVVLKPGLPPGPFREGVRIETDHPDRKEIAFAVAGRVAAPIAVVPERLRLPAIRSTRGGEAVATLAVRGRRKTEFRVDHRPDRVEVEIVPAARPAAPGTYRLRARIAPGGPGGSIRDAIVLKTDHPHQPEVRIPIEAIILDGG